MDLTTLREYINIHKISLEQDIEDANNDIPIAEDEYYESDLYYEGAIATCNHLLEYIDEQ
jgi:hypothetical protein